MKKLLVGILALFALNASAQFIPGQVLKSSDLNAALAAPTITGGSINGAPIGQTTPAAVKGTTGIFMSGMDSTPIGQVDPAVGAFKNLSASGDANGATGLPPTSGSLLPAYRIRNGGSTPVMDFGVDTDSTNASWIQARRSSDYSTNYNLLLQPNGGKLAVGTSAIGPGALTVYAPAGGQGVAVAQFDGPANFGTYFYTGATSNTANGADTVIKVAANSVTGRSINAAGTINASGADYAEYMRKAAGVGELKPGQIVGVDSDGNLTDHYSAAVSFLIVSTDPSYIGGDTWGSEKAVGMAHPEKPASNATAAERAKYLADKAKFDALLALAQSRVAIIAYAGQVPVNVKGGKPGQYVIPVRGKGDTIVGRFVDAASMTFQQYRTAVGIVQNVLPDGRANVRVKVL